ETHERVLEFAARQALDTAAPSNTVLTNPALLRATAAQAGWNLVRGANNALEDLERLIGGRPPLGSEAFEPGREVAATPGKIVYSNELIELIQYAPTTTQVYPEPILITPAWIMKYYILDLSPERSMVKYLLARGHTVFMISWKNPDAGDRDLTMDDYRRLGVAAALEQVGRITPGRRVHGVGYCIGGALLAIAAAAMARDGDDRFESLTFLAAQFDFSEPGELQLFINESQVRFLEALMWEQGYLDAAQMAGAFFMLRSRDLIWSRIVQDYLFGRRAPLTELMAWNADGTRMPYAMHAEYLRRLYLGNDLAEGRFPVDGRPVAIADIEAPIFSVATTSDHVAPWRSVYKIHLLADVEVTFLLTTGGHNAGIISPPGHPRRAHQVAANPADAPYQAPDAWARETPLREGSWWPVWAQWLAERSGAPQAPPSMGRARTADGLADAPGAYVFQR
ncbi:MAG: alpha/beta fold hydrolase, partial [Pseudomonadota bacterium]